MYGIVEIQGHQYRVKSGDIIDVQKIEAEVGAAVDFDQVLFIGGDVALVGAPVVNKAVVKAKVIKQDRGEKILMMKRAPGKWRKRRGHRQSFTGLLITEIQDGTGKVSKIDASSKAAAKHLK